MNLFNCHTHISRNSNFEILSALPFEMCSEIHSLGIHPWRIEDYKFENLESIYKEYVNINTIAIGEIGLDKMIKTDLSRQKSFFLKQIEISENYRLPVILHCVKSWNEIKELKRRLNPLQTWVYHGFNKSNILTEVLNENIVISIGASILKNLKLQDLVEKIPDERLLLETDASETEIQEIYQKVAQLKGITLVSLQKIIEQNCKRIFPKWQIG